MGERVIFVCNYDEVYKHRGGGWPPESDLDAIKRFRHQGNLMGIVTDSDPFLAWALHGKYMEQFDFIVCAGGSCVIARTPVGDKDGELSKVFCKGIHRYFLGELYDFFTGVKALSISADVEGFMSGYSEAERFRDAFDPALGSGCSVHFWNSIADFFHADVNRDALLFARSFSQCTATFGSDTAAEGAAMEINRRYNGLRAYSVDKSVFVVYGHCSNSSGIAEFAGMAGVSADDVWILACGSGDPDMLREFNGIAKSDGHPAVLAATDRHAMTVEEAIGIICGK